MKTFHEICSTGSSVVGDGGEIQATRWLLQWLQQYTLLNLDAISATPEKALEMLIKGAPVPMVLTCPVCGARHIDKGEFAVKPHHTHACQACGLCWRPAVVPTVGVQFLPGFKDEER
jgi:rubredoxin